SRGALDVAEAHGRKNLAVGERLLRQAAEFDFFQAVRLLEWMAWEADSSGAIVRQPVGEDHRPAEEIVRFRVPPTFGFASAEIVGLKVPPDSAEGRLDHPLEMSVAFLGLVGSIGELPQHYTSEAIARGQNQDLALR